MQSVFYISGLLILSSRRSNQQSGIFNN